MMGELERKYVYNIYNEDRLKDANNTDDKKIPFLNLTVS